MAINIGQVATIMSDVEKHRTRIEQEALMKEQEELKLKLGYEQLENAKLQNELFRKTLPIRIEEEFLKLKQTEAETYMKSIDKEFYRESAETDLELKRMNLRAMDTEFMIRARENVLDEWAEEVFKNSEMTEEEINRTVQKKIVLMSDELNEMIQNEEKTKEFFSSRYEKLESIKNKINENKRLYSKTKDPKYMEENEILLDIQTDIFAEVKIGNAFIDENKQAYLQFLNNKDKMAVDTQSELTKQKNELFQHFDRLRAEFMSNYKNKIVPTPFTQAEIEKEANAYAIKRLSESDTLRQIYPLAYASLANQYRTSNVEEILSKAFTGGIYGTKEFTTEQFEILQDEFLSSGGKVYVDDSRKVYTPEFKNYLLDKVKENRFDIRAFNEKITKQRNIINGQMSENYKKNIKRTPNKDEKEVIFAEARTKMLNEIDLFKLKSKSIQEIQEIFVEIYADISRKRGFEPDLTMFLDYNPELDDIFYNNMNIEIDNKSENDMNKETDNKINNNVNIETNGETDNDMNKEANSESEDNNE